MYAYFRLCSLTELVRSQSISLRTSSRKNAEAKVGSVDNTSLLSRRPLSSDSKDTVCLDLALQGSLASSKVISPSPTLEAVFRPRQNSLPLDFKILGNTSEKKMVFVGPRPDTECTAQVSLQSQQMLGSSSSGQRILNVIAAVMDSDIRFLKMTGKGICRRLKENAGVLLCSDISTTLSLIDAKKSIPNKKESVILMWMEKGSIRQARIHEYRGLAERISFIVTKFGQAINRVTNRKRSHFGSEILSSLSRLNLAIPCFILTTDVTSKYNQNIIKVSGSEILSCGDYHIDTDCNCFSSFHQYLNLYLFSLVEDRKNSICKAR